MTASLSTEVKSLLYNNAATHRRARRQSDRLVKAAAGLSETERAMFVGLALDFRLPEVWLRSARRTQKQNPSGADRLRQNCRELFGDPAIQVALARISSGEASPLTYRSHRKQQLLRQRDRCLW